MTLTMFGIANCDTIKKARNWLETHGIEYAFHDYKASGADAGKLREWVAEHGWETILNRAGTTFRALPDADKQGLDADKAVALMLANPSMIKRPVLDLGEKRIVGFKPDVYIETFAKQ
jgi:arsenate reductase